MNEIHENVEKTFVNLETEECDVVEDGVTYIETTTYRVYSDGSKEFACSTRQAKTVMEVEPEPTDAELIRAELLLNQAEILAKQNEHDEVLAEILLNQLGV